MHAWHCDIICLAQHLEKSNTLRHTGVILNDINDSLYRKVDIRRKNIGKIEKENFQHFFRFNLYQREN